MSDKNEDTTKFFTIRGSEPRVTHVDGKETYSEFFDAVVPEGVEWPMVDGEPVMPGDTLWDDEGFMINVTGVEFKGDGYCVLHVFNEHIRNVACTIDTTSKCFPTLTRTEPETVLDRDGVPIEVGDTVYEVDGAHKGWKMTVRKVTRTLITFENEYGDELFGSPNLCTHKEPDSWGRLDEDAGKSYCVYFGYDEPGSENCACCPTRDIGASTCYGSMCLDLLRRAKALAGVDDE